MNQRMNWGMITSERAESPLRVHLNSHVGPNDRLIVGSRIAFFVVLVAMTIALMASGCAVGYTETYPDNGYGPDLVYAAPGVQVIADYDEPVFFSDGLYWRFSGGYWYRSPYYNRGWIAGRPPAAVLSIRQPQAFVHYRPAGWAPRGRAAPPPRFDARRGAPPPRAVYGAPPPRVQPQGWRGGPAPAPRAQPQGWRGGPAPAARPVAPAPRAQPQGWRAPPQRAAPPARGGGQHHDHR